MDSKYSSSQMDLFPSIRDIKVVFYPSTSKVYGFGGYINDSLSNSLVEYDTRFESYTLISPSGPAPCARVHHAICIRHASLYIYGGLNAENKPLNDLWRFDIKHQTWSQVILVNMSIPAICHHSMAIVENKLYIAGGIMSLPKEQTVPENTISLLVICLTTFNCSRVSVPEASRFQIPSLPPSEICSESFSYTISNNSILYFRIPSPRKDCFLFPYAGSLLLYGGNSVSGIPLNDVWRYDITKAVWTLCRDVDFSVPVMPHQQACLAGSYIVTIGGSTHILSLTSSSQAAYPRCVLSAFSLYDHDWVISSTRDVAPLHHHACVYVPSKSEHFILLVGGAPVPRRTMPLPPPPVFQLLSIPDLPLISSPTDPVTPPSSSRPSDSLQPPSTPKGHPTPAKESFTNSRRCQTTLREPSTPKDNPTTPRDDPLPTRLYPHTPIDHTIHPDVLTTPERHQHPSNIPRPSPLKPSYPPIALTFTPRSPQTSQNEDGYDRPRDDAYLTRTPNRVRTKTAAHSSHHRTMSTPLKCLCPRGLTYRSSGYYSTPSHIKKPTVLAEDNGEEMFNPFPESFMTSKTLQRPPAFPETSSTPNAHGGSSSTPNTHGGASSNTSNGGATGISSGMAIDVAFAPKDGKVFALESQKAAAGHSELPSSLPDDEVIMGVFDETMENIKNMSSSIRQCIGETAALSLRIENAEAEKKNLDEDIQNSYKLLRASPDGEMSIDELRAKLRN